MSSSGPMGICEAHAGLRDKWSGSWVPSLALVKPSCPKASSDGMKKELFSPKTIVFNASFRPLYNPSRFSLLESLLIVKIDSSRHMLSIHKFCIGRNARTKTRSFGWGREFAHNVDLADVPNLSLAQVRLQLVRSGPFVRRFQLQIEQNNIICDEMWMIRGSMVCMLPTLRAVHYQTYGDQYNSP